MILVKLEHQKQETTTMRQLIIFPIESSKSQLITATMVVVEPISGSGAYFNMRKLFRSNISLQGQRPYSTLMILPVLLYSSDTWYLKQKNCVREKNAPQNFTHLHRDSLVSTDRQRTFSQIGHIAISDRFKCILLDALILASDRSPDGHLPSLA